MSTTSVGSLREKFEGSDNSASLGAIGSLLGKLDELLHNCEDGAAPIQKLREDVCHISTKMVRLSKVRDPPHTVNYWMKDVRELSYDMDDFFIRELNHAQDAKAKMVGEISVFEPRVGHVNEQYENYNLEEVISQATNTGLSYHLQTVYREIEPVGMEDRIEKLHSLVEPKGDSSKHDRKLKVVSILGAQGLGKSMLAQKLWRYLEKDFGRCRAFVQIARKPDIRRILRSILSQVRPKQPLEDSRVPNLIQDIRKHLRYKRYFIVIDDLWAISLWDIIRRAFPDGKNCSRVIITTTIEDVAQACCSYEPCNIVDIKILNSDIKLNELFVSRVIGFGKKCPKEFVPDSYEITRQCGGLPLAIICIASLVGSQWETKQQMDNVEKEEQLDYQKIEQQLGYVKSFLHTNLRINATSVEILNQVLKLCYRSLPDCLKTCLLYLSMYPENYLILKEDLVKQWMAEDFIFTAEDKDTARVASTYFDNFVSLGLIRRMDICKHNTKQLSYAVHPVVFDFITCKSMEDNFITVIDYSQSTVMLTDKIRRLSLHFGSATYASLPTTIGLSQVRSLAFMGLLGCMPSLVEFKLVRVVILHVLGDNGDTSFPLTGISQLLLLRYLQVRCNITVELPDKMGRLKHLETLDIHARVAAVPLDIVQLPRLLHLHLGRYHHHRHLTQRYLSSLHKLLAASYVHFLDNPSRAFSLLVLLFEFMPLMCNIPRPLRWIAHFRNLRFLDVVLKELRTYEVDVLAKLWALTFLSLNVRRRTAGDIHFRRGAAFPALRYFNYMCGDAEESDSRSTEYSLFQDGIPSLDIVDGEHDPAERNWIQDIGFYIFCNWPNEVPVPDRRSPETAFQDRIYREHVPSEHIKDNNKVDIFQPPDEVREKLPGARNEDLSNDQHVDTSDWTAPNSSAGEALVNLPLLLATLAATVTYQLGLNPTGAIWEADITEHNNARDPILSMSPWRYMAFLYCCSLATTIFFQKDFWFKYYALHVAMILDLIGLMAAYALASCQGAIYYYVMAFVGAVLVYMVIHVAFFTLERHKWLYNLAVLVATIGYQAGLTDFWLKKDDESRHVSGDPGLQYPSPYETFSYWNSLSFKLSCMVLGIIFVSPNLNKPATRSNVDTGRVYGKYLIDLLVT